MTTKWSRANRAARSTARRRVAFIGHQLVEYGLAAALLIVAFEQRGSVGLVCAVLGGALGVLALLTKARLGAFHLLPLRSHHVLDVLIALALIASPAYAWHTIHLPGVIAAEVLAALMLWMERLTAYIDRPRRPSPPPPPTPRPTSPVEIGAVASQIANRSARQLGTATGVARRMVRERAARRGRT
jgi:hypothetical protein